VSFEQIIQLFTTIGMAGGAFVAGWQRVGSKRKASVEDVVLRLEGKVDTIAESVTDLVGKVAVVEDSVKSLPQLEKRVSDADRRLTHVEYYKARLEDLGY
jgi:hypothetical protein